MRYAKFTDTLTVQCLSGPQDAVVWYVQASNGDAFGPFESEAEADKKIAAEKSWDRATRYADRQEQREHC